MYLEECFIHPLIVSYIYQVLFPINLKLAVVISLFKNGNRQQIKNCRPIMILSGFFKLIEKRTLYTQEKILIRNLHRFRPGLSINSAAFNLT